MGLGFRVWGIGGLNRYQDYGSIFLGLGFRVPQMDFKMILEFLEAPVVF